MPPFLGGLGDAVSIPIGFSQALQRAGDGKTIEMSSFQSLSGFLRPCNVGTAADDFLADTRVSIPIGFSQALQRFDGES